MRPLLLAGAACALLLSACGGSRPAAPIAPVHVAVTAPGDLSAVRTDHVQVQGTVRPARADVTVGGARVGVSGGTWSASVALQPGVNLVDVLASAGRARPALTVVRVRRLIEVRVPDLAGATVDQARQRLADVGLKARFQDTGGGFFDQLLGGTPQVCDTTPPAGRQVDPGATVQVTVGRRC
ncbi:MAG: hypothetical protein QOH30_3034 [Baekduia sp.]|jgi:hypothetical protein|nr:hypothetical protein [Baekduia sp.]MDX6731638.1 hypothetical protein [Baekduia sp.]